MASSPASNQSIEISVLSGILERALRRAFPELSGIQSLADSKLMQRIATATNRPIDEVFGILLGDKQAERELGFTPVVIDPNAFNFPEGIVLPQSILDFFVPVAKCQDSATFVSHTPLLAMSPDAMSLAAAAAQVPRISVVYTPPDLFETALRLMERSDRHATAFSPSQNLLMAGADGLPYINLEGFQGNPNLNALAPVAMQRCYKIVPIYFFGDQYLTLATAREPDIFKRSEIRSHFRDFLEIRYVAADPERIAAVIAANELSGVDSVSLVGQLSGVSAESAEGMEVVYVDAATIGERASQNDASIIPLLDAFLAYATKHNASDLHIAPFDTHLSVEYRVDDWKHRYPEAVPVKLASPIISRLKYLSNIDIQRLTDPQYGRFTIRLKNYGDIEVRTTIMPTVYGDAVTLRFAPKGGRIKTLEENGMQPHEVGIIRRVIEGSSGLLLVVGPTGAGKSTTLYSVLSSINTDQWEVLSAEEPPERYLPGIKQTDITRGISYAKFLAGALRADPDYINIGEIRTPDTAAQLIRAVETGHICCTTLHTAQACGAPGRMFGLEVSPYALADTLSAVIAQTLVARVCPKCGQEVDPPSDAEMRELGIKSRWFGSSPVFREGRGCSHCMMRGFRGRMLVSEGFYVDSTIRDLILKRVPSEQIRKAQELQGGRTMLQQACEAAALGIIPLSKALALGASGRD